jgi:hypothetical protein
MTMKSCALQHVIMQYNYYQYFAPEKPATAIETCTIGGMFITFASNEETMIVEQPDDTIFTSSPYVEELKAAVLRLDRVEARTRI